MTSSSMGNAIARSLTSIVDRAGYGSETNSSSTAFTLATSPVSSTNRVALMTSSKELPAASRMAPTFSGA